MAASVDDLRGEDTIIVDELYKDRLGVAGIGSTTEINGRRARVVGFTRGIRCFTTAPYIFTSFKSGLNYLGGVAADEELFLLVKVAPGTAIGAVKHQIEQRVSGVEVFTNAEMAHLRRAEAEVESARAQLAEAQAKTAEALLAQTRELENAGAASKLDIARAEQQLEGERTRQITAQKDRDVLDRAAGRDDRDGHRTRQP